MAKTAFGMCPPTKPASKTNDSVVSATKSFIFGSSRHQHTVTADIHVHVETECLRGSQIQLHAVLVGTRMTFSRIKHFLCPRIDDAEAANRDCLRHRENPDDRDERPLQTRPCNLRSA